MKLLNLEEYLTPESIKVHDINQWDSFLFNLLEEENIYPPKLTGQWITDKNRFYEKFVCLKEVTENTYYICIVDSTIQLKLLFIIKMDYMILDVC